MIVPGVSVGISADTMEEYNKYAEQIDTRLL